MSDKQRIIDLQKSVRVARQALEAIAGGWRDPEAMASDALDAMWRLERKQPLQHLVGHERKVQRR